MTGDYTIDWDKVTLSDITDWNSTTSTVTVTDTFVSTKATALRLEEDCFEEDGEVEVEGVGICTFRELKEWLANRTRDLPEPYSIGVHV